MNVQSAWEWGGGATGNYFGGKIKKNGRVLCQTWLLLFFMLANKLYWPRFWVQIRLFLNKQFLRPEKPENMDGKEQRPSPPFMKEVYMICFFPVDWNRKGSFQCKFDHCSFYQHIPVHIISYKISPQHYFCHPQYSPSSWGEISQD